MVKNKRNIGLFFILTLLMSACIRPQVKLQKEIESGEALLNLDSIPVPDPQKAKKLIDLYLKYANDYQDDTLSPAYLFKAGELYVATGDYKSAMENFNRVQRYPNFRKVAVALFLQGFVAENHMHDTVLAKNYYEKFIGKYPNHELADDAKMMLQQISLSPEALIKMFEEQQTVKDSVANANH